MIWEVVRFGGAGIVVLYIIRSTLSHKRYYITALNVTVLIGLLMNAACVLSNGGRMPVSEWRGAQSVEDGSHTLMHPNHHLKWLADAHGNPTKYMYSIGDVFATVPILLLPLSIFLELRRDRGRTRQTGV